MGDLHAFAFVEICDGNHRNCELFVRAPVLRQHDLAEGAGAQGTMQLVLLKLRLEALCFEQELETVGLVILLVEVEESSSVVAIIGLYRVEHRMSAMFETDSQRLGNTDMALPHVDRQLGLCLLYTSPSPRDRG